MKSKTEVVARSAATGRFVIDTRRSETIVTQGMREAAARIAKSVMKERELATTK